MQADGGATRHPGSRLAYADGIRGLAALWVVLFHASEGGHLDRLKAACPAWLVRVVFDWGHLGVAVFFVLSGFVMMHSARAADDAPGFARRFMARRLVRLTPPYYASIAFVVAYGVAKAWATTEPAVLPGAGMLAAHALYLQDILRQPTLSVVYWTLCVEVQFYLAFTLVLGLKDVLRRRVPGVSSAAAALGLASVVALPWATGAVTDPLFAGSFFPFWFAFVVGALASLTGRDRAATVLFAAWIAVLGLSWAFRPSGMVGASLLAALALVAGSRWRLLAALLEARPLQFLGLVSFTLYLIHNQLSGGTAFVVSRLLPATAMGDLVKLGIVLVVCLLVAWLGYRLVERPSIQASRRIALRPARIEASAA